MRTKDVIQRYFKNNKLTSPDGNELAIRKIDNTIIDVTLTEELSYEQGWNDAICKISKLLISL